MYYYKIYGLRIKSDYLLEEALEIPEVSDDNIDVEIVQGELDERLTTETEIDDRYEGGYVYRFEAKRGWLRSKGQGCCLMEDGSKVTYQLKENYNPLVMNQVFLCAVLPNILIQRGEIALHGSGILWENKAIIISGVSGAGKSTLAKELLKNGGVFMADDTVALCLREQKVYAQGGYPQQKICLDAMEDLTFTDAEVILLPPDGGKDKYAVRLKQGFCMEEQEVQALFIVGIEEVEQVSIREIKGNEKIKYLLDNLYKYKTYVELGMPANVFKQCIEIANKVKIYRISRPKQGMTVAEQVKEIKKVLK